MSYQKQNFANGEVLSASQLNHIEQGIVDLENNAQASESALLTKITEETTRAKAAEQANANGIAAEASRAKGEEQRLNTAITAETTRAERAEQALDTRTAALESCGFVVVDGKVCMKYVKS